MPFSIVCQDITKMNVDAIVNAANTNLKMGGGVCGAIFRAAGVAKLQTACDKLAPIKTGEAVITPGFDLPAKYVIHAVGPIYQDWNKEQCEQLLRAAYTNSLKTAIGNKCKSIAFPLISSGIYGYPKDKALQVATSAILDFLADHDIEVTLVIFDKSSFIVSQKLLGEVDRYIAEHYVGKHRIKSAQMPDAEQPHLSGVEETGKAGELFSNILNRLIDAKRMSDNEVYKRANIDSKLLSRIMSDKGFMPEKRTVMALAVALELSLDETKDLLKRAGYSLSHFDKFDVIMEYFIDKGKYNVFNINEVLFKLDQPLLGG